MSAAILKILAVIFMLIDHVGSMLYRDAVLNLGYGAAQGLLWLRVIGRVAFPLFAFLIAESAAHTRDLKKYILRLTVFAFLAEIPYDMFITLLSRGKVNELISFTTQNVLFTLAAGALAVYFYKKAWEDRPNAVLWAGSAAAVIPASIMIAGEYQPAGVVMVLLCYIFRPKNGDDADVRVHGSRIAQAVACLLPLMLFYFTTNWGWRQYGALGALVFIMLYNGKPGPRRGKYFFYAFYPAHLLILAGLTYLIANGYFSFFI